MRFVCCAVVLFVSSLFPVAPTAYGSAKATQDQSIQNHIESQPPTISLKEAKDHIIKRVDAPYPAIATAAHVAGVVLIAVEVDVNGDVTKVVPLSGPAMLQGAAADAAKQYKFRPFIVNGVPAVIRTAVAVSFQLGRSKSN